jgi:four helix bundle protein
MQDYTKLVVWQRARSLIVSVNEVAKGFPPAAAPGLRAQLIRSTMSIGANIAEGAARSSRTDFARFVTIAAGSTSEAEHHLVVAGDLGLVDASIGARLVDRLIEVRRMLFGLRRALLAAELACPADNGVGPADSTPH